MRKCVYCGPKEDTEFNRRGKHYQSVCRKCQNDVSKKHYEANKESYKQRNAKRREKVRDYLIQTKSVPCLDCSKMYPHYVMEFDHLGDKDFTIGEFRVHGFALNRIKAEIAKCEIVCSNCHKERTWKRRNNTGLV